MGEWAVNHDKKKTHVDIVDTSDARPRGLGSSVRQISNNTNGKTEKKQYDNTKCIFLDVWRGFLLAAPGMAHLAGVLQSRLWVRGGRSPDRVIIKM